MSMLVNPVWWRMKTGSSLPLAGQPDKGKAVSSRFIKRPLLGNKGACRAGHLCDPSHNCIHPTHKHTYILLHTQTYIYSSPYTTAYIAHINIHIFFSIYKTMMPTILSHASLSVEVESQHPRSNLKFNRDRVSVVAFTNFKY